MKKTLGCLSAILLLTAALITIVPVASADGVDQLGGSPGSVSFSSAVGSPNLPSTTIAVGSCTGSSCALGGGYTLTPGGPGTTNNEDFLGWSLQSTIPSTIVTTFNPTGGVCTGGGVAGALATCVYSQYPTYGTTSILGFAPVSMNGSTATLNIGDSGGDDVFGNVVWTSVLDAGGSAATLLGTFTVTSETLGPTTGPAGNLESVFVGQFPNTGIVVNSVDTIALSITSCTYGGAPVDCLSSDPTGSVSGFSIQSASSTTPAPEPGSLILVASGLVAIAGFKRFLAS